MLISALQAELKAESKDEVKRTDLDESPACTTNNLRDIIDWLQLGDYVIIHCHGKNGRFFHTKCAGSELSEDQVQPFLEQARVISIDVNDMPGLLDEGEWEYYIKREGHQECTCLIKERARLGKDVPHKFMFNC